MYFNSNYTLIIININYKLYTIKYKYYSKMWANTFNLVIYFFIYLESFISCNEIT